MITVNYQLSNMKYSFLFLLVLSISLSSIAQVDKEKLKQEIIAMEKAFETELNEKGVAQAFYNYAAKDAVIKRQNDTLIKGKEAIRQYYSQPAYKTAHAWWTPDYVDISDDGSMAYTYGKYTWEMVNADGKKISYSGVFHTVWRKMKDGSWKYVWD